MRTKRDLVVGMVGLLLLCLMAVAVHAEPNVVVTFQEGVDGYTGTADTYLDNDSATPSYNTANYGGFGWLRIGKLTAGMQQAGMVRFDNIIGNGPGQIPPGVTIVSATLRMTAFAVYDKTNAGSHHYINPMKTSWVEGSVTREESYPFYSVTEEGASCADYRHYRADPCDYTAADYWGGVIDPNATNGPVWGIDIEPTMQTVGYFTDPPGTDTFPTVAGSYDPDYYPISDNYWNTNYGTVGIDFDVKDVVQAWLDGTLDNNGWWMQTHYENDHLYYFSSEYGEVGVSPDPPPAGYVSYRPTLRVEFRPLLCGDATVPYPAGDISGPAAERDCHTDMYDVVKIAAEWLKCTVPDQAGCQQFANTYVISHDTVLVDANLAEWADADWIALDKIYNGEPNDIGPTAEDAKFALKWNETTDKVYAAVVIDDKDHVLENIPLSWDSSDQIEVYAQGNPVGGTGAYAPDYDTAQQYRVGKGLSVGVDWARWGNNATIDPCALFESAVTIDGSKIIYEVGATMFELYGGISGDPTVVRQLAAGMDVGFDIVAGTRYDSAPYGDDFGMRSENLMFDKYADADLFQKYALYDAVDNCGLWGYFTADIDRNCTVGLSDFSVVAGDWMYCTDPNDPLCDMSWMP